MRFCIEFSRPTVIHSTTKTETCSKKGEQELAPGQEFVSSRHLKRMLASGTSYDTATHVTIKKYVYTVYYGDNIILRLWFQSCFEQFTPKNSGLKLVHCVVLPVTSFVQHSNIKMVSANGYI